jgi:tripeptide aminopeptidase
MRDSLLQRFLRYVRVESTADENSTTYPSTPGQLDMGRLLTDELKALGIDATMSEHGIVVGTVPATVTHAPTIALFAHVDTSPDYCGGGVNPIVIERYAGGDIVLSGDPTKIIRSNECPELPGVEGHTLITTDGTTLLGADDKCGVAVIMEVARHLMANRDIPIGTVRVCFTCDEEIGHGVDHVDMAALGAVAGYTLDGEGAGHIENETFSADQAVVTVTGVNIHPAMGKDRLVNAIKIAGEFLCALPQGRLSPETTADREGFVHPYVIEGTVAEAHIKVLLRDFDTAQLAMQKTLLEATAKAVAERHPKARIDVAINSQYRNMADGLKAEPRAVQLAVEAMEAIGLEPHMSSIRGGTDGSRLTELGLPTPNLSTGMHNFHSPLEWASLDEMECAVRAVIELVRRWGTHK